MFERILRILRFVFFVIFVRFIFVRWERWLICKFFFRGSLSFRLYGFIMVMFWIVSG